MFSKGQSNLMIFKELNNEKCKTYLIGCSQHKKAVLVDAVSQKIDRYLAIFRILRT